MKNITVNCDGIKISNKEKICLIAGPCQLENKQHALDMAGKISEISNTNLIKQFKKAYREFDISNVAEKLKGISRNNDSLNKSIADNSSIEIKSIGEIEISILRQSIFEIENSEIDYPIVINEAVKLAKKFGQEDSYRFINLVLDSYIDAR